jgi:hypothetical protein
VKLDFKNGPDRNGNMYYLRIDTDARTYSTNRVLWGGLKITRAELRYLKEEAKADGYKEE